MNTPNAWHPILKRTIGPVDSSKQDHKVVSVPFFSPLWFLYVLLIFALQPRLFAQQSQNDNPSSTHVKPLDGTVHSRYPDTITGKERELKILFSEGAVKEIQDEGELVPPEKWSKYEATIQGIRQDYEDSMSGLDEAEEDLQRADHEMQHAQEDIPQDDIQIALNVVDSALQEAFNAIEELGEFHGDDIRKGITEARKGVLKATEEFRREDLPAIHSEIKKTLKYLQDSFDETDQSKGSGQHVHKESGMQKPTGKAVDDKQKQEQDQNQKKMESTLEQLENK